MAKTTVVKRGKKNVSRTPVRKVRKTSKKRRPNARSLDAMHVESVAISKLVPDPANARKHSRRNLDAIMGSLAAFGQQKPIVVDGKNRVVAGNGTVEAAKALGWKSINVVRTTLEGGQAKSFAIADNRTSELAEWDYQELADQLRALETLVDLQTLGWDQGELENLLAAEWTPPETEPMPGTEPEPPAVPPLNLTAEQRQVLDRAVEKCRGSEGNELTEGNCVEIICTRYLED